MKEERYPRVGWLQWATGIYCIVFGALILVAPHEVRDPTYALLQTYLPWWGAAFILTGVGMLVVASLAVPRWLAVVGHLAVATMLLLLAVSSGLRGAGTGLIDYGALAVGVLVATLFLHRDQPHLAVTAPSDFFSIVMSTLGILNGLYSLFDLRWHPALKTFAITPLAVAILIGGFGVIAVQLRPSVRRELRYVAYFVLGAAYSLAGVYAALFQVWGMAMLLSGFGVSLALLPWIFPRVSAADRNSLRVRLSLALAAASACAAILVMIPASENVESAARLQAQVIQRFSAMRVAADVATDLTLRQGVVSAFASQPGLLDQDAATLRLKLQMIASQLPDATYFAIYDASGRGVVRSDGGPLDFLGDTPLFDDARDRKTSFSLAWPLAAADSPLITIVAPIRGDDGVFRGIVLGNVPAGLTLGRNSASSPDVEPNMYLVDGNGRVLASATGSTEDPRVSLTTGPIFDSLVRQAGPAASISGTPDHEWVEGYMPLASADFGIVVSGPVEKLLEPARASREWIFAMFLVVVVVALATGFFVGTELTKPLVAVAHAADDLASGIRTAPLPRTDTTELARLTNAFGAMREQITAQQQAVEDERKTLVAILSDMTDGVLVLDAARRVLFCNRAAGLLLKLDPAIIVGRSADDVGAEFVPSLWKIREALRLWPAEPTRPDNRLSFDVATTDDSPRTLAVDLFPVGDGTTAPTGLAVLVRDVTSSTLLTALREREKVAMDLHDGIIQSLYALALGLSAKERLAQKQRNGQVRQELHLALQRVDSVIAEIRQYIARLRLNQTDRRGLEAQLHALASEFQEHGLPRPQISVDPGISVLLGVDATAHVLQIVREATSNAIRHASATSVGVSFQWRGDEAVLTIVDDGGGFDSTGVRDPTGQGVSNMEERARALGGSLSISSTPGRGTEVRIGVSMSSRKLAG